MRRQLAFIFYYYCLKTYKQCFSFSFMFTLAPQIMESKHCGICCIKKGKQKTKQRYYCKNCRCYQRDIYNYKKCSQEDEHMIVKLITKDLESAVSPE